MLGSLILENILVLLKILADKQMEALHYTVGVL